MHRGKDSSTVSLSLPICSLCSSITSNGHRGQAMSLAVSTSCTVAWREVILTRRPLRIGAMARRPGKDVSPVTRSCGRMTPLARNNDRVAATWKTMTWGWTWRDDDAGPDVEVIDGKGKPCMPSYVGSRAYSDTPPSLQRTAQQWFAD
jgi:hypothetical protein